MNDMRWSCVREDLVARKLLQSGACHGAAAEALDNGGAVCAVGSVEWEECWRCTVDAYDITERWPRRAWVRELREALEGKGGDAKAEEAWARVRVDLVKSHIIKKIGCSARDRAAALGDVGEYEPVHEPAWLLRWVTAWNEYRRSGSWGTQPWLERERVGLPGWDKALWLEGVRKGLLGVWGYPLGPASWGRVRGDVVRARKQKRKEKNA